MHFNSRWYSMIETTHGQQESLGLIALPYHAAQSLDKEVGFCDEEICSFANIASDTPMTTRQEPVLEQAMSRVAKGLSLIVGTGGADHSTREMRPI